MAMVRSPWMPATAGDDRSYPFQNVLSAPDVAASEPAGSSAVAELFVEET